MTRHALFQLALAFSIGAIFSISAFETKAETYGGQGGADLSIDAIEPDGENVTLGLAGEHPADITRYLLASGAGVADLSPDGQTIAFLWDITGESELWTMASHGGQPKQVTFKTGVASPYYSSDDAFWTPDGQRLFFSADLNGDEQPGYFAITSDGLQGSSVLPAQSGDFRIFGAFADQERFLYASTARGTGVFDVYQGSLSGKSELVLEADLGFFAVSASPDGRYAIVTETVGEDADNLYLFDLRDRSLSIISKPDVTDRASHTLGGFEWTSDSKMFYFSTNAGREFAALARYEIGAEAFETVTATDADIENLELCDGDTNLLAYTENRDGFDQLMLRSLKDGSSVPAPDLPEGKYQLDCESADQTRLLVRVSGWSAPGALWMINPETGTSQEVFSSNLAGIDPNRLVRPKPVRYVASDGVELQGLLYLPKQPENKENPPPVVFKVHGGPSGQSQATFKGPVQYLLQRGVAVFEPNIRGSTGLGRSYSTLDDRENRLNSIRDLVDLLKALGKDGLVDPNRALVMGGSYGGYAVNAVLAEYPDAFQAGVSAFGVADWVSALEVASPALKASDRIEYGDITEARWRSFYEENSPIRNADKIKVPVLFSHGVMDPRIDIAETETMVKALRSNGIEAPFLRIPDEGHGWRKLSNQIFYYRRLAEFIDQHLKLPVPD